MAVIDGLIYELDGEFYYIKSGRRYRLYSQRALFSWGLRVVRGAEEARKLPVASRPLGFRDGTLIHNFADGKMYVVSGGKRRQVTSPDTLKKHGWSKRDFLVVSDKEAALHEEGETL